MMTVFTVYQPHLNDQQRAELNGPNGGWFSKPEFISYTDVRDGSPYGRAVDMDDLHDLITEAVSHGLYYHVADITAVDLQEAFMFGNTHPHSKVKYIGDVSMKSISIGDVLIDTNTGIAYYCNRYGWTRLSPITAQLFK